MSAFRLRYPSEWAPTGWKHTDFVKQASPIHERTERLDAHQSETVMVLCFHRGIRGVGRFCLLGCLEFLGVSGDAGFGNDVSGRQCGGTVH